jgi:leader peptidase (prepilin peptidase)/N-methyltransferase
MGALLGFPLFFYALFLSAILAIIPSLIATYTREDKAVPFVPFLAIATFIVYIADEQFILLGQWLMYG